MSSTARWNHKVDQPIGVLKTAVRIIHSDLIRLSDGSYQISIDLEALDCWGKIAIIEAWNHVDDILQAWKIIEPLRPETMHYVEGEYEYIGKNIRLMAPSFFPYLGEMDEISSFIASDGATIDTQTLPSVGSKTVCGCIRNIIIDKTKGGDVAFIQLVERDDYHLVIFPDLFETHKNMIFGERYLEYCGILQSCYVEFVSGEYGSDAIIVTSIVAPDFTYNIEEMDQS